MMERKCFVCGDFEHIAHNCRNTKSEKEKGSTPMLSNKFEVLRSRVINVGISGKSKEEKYRRTILRKERQKE